MLRATCVLLCTLLVLSHLNPTLARKSFTSGRHSYPKSNSGLSGSGGSRSHSYPKSGGGLSGSSGHGYPSSGGGLSGNSGHGYPSSGGGLSGGGQSHSYPPAGGSPSHTYPSNTQSGSHGYPSSSGGLSGNSRPAATTQVHHHYHYSPPQSIQYTPAHGPPVSYPVYRGAPPSYVYQYKDSGSKYSNLLAGLALLNLGALAGAAIGSSASHSSQSSSYKARPGEVCKFGIRKDNGDYEETRIDCQLISSFILEDEANKKNNGTNNTVITTTTVTNTTVVNTTNDVPAAAPAAEQPATVEAPKVTTYNMYENGTLVPVKLESVNETAAVANETAAAVANETAAVADTNAATNNTASSTSSVTVTTTTTVTNATDVKGPPVDVTPGMKCYLIRNSPVSNMKKTIPCGVLQTYADKSLKKNAGNTATATFSVLITCVFMVFTQY